MTKEDLDRRILALIGRGALAPRGGEFERLALDLFAHQFERIPRYRAFCRKAGISPFSIRRFEEIPPFPTSAFKGERIASFGESEEAFSFLTSGSSVGNPGCHAMDTSVLYDLSCSVSFRDLARVQVEGCALLSLISPVGEAPRSSLSRMVETLSRDFFPQRTFCAIRKGALLPEEAIRFAVGMARSGIPLFIAATSSALSEWIPALRNMPRPIRLPAGSSLFETGGRKGKRPIPSSVSLANALEELLGIERESYLGEYGMTELSSPSWGRLKREAIIYRSPSWAPVRVLHPADGREVAVGGEGMIAVFDSANRGSVSALCTGDWGRRHPEGFEVLDRTVDSEIRGCSLSLARSSGAHPAPKAERPGLEREKEALREAPSVDRERAAVSLGLLTELWLNRGSAERRSLEASLLRSPSFSPGGVAAGLDRSFQALTGEKLAAIARRIPSGSFPRLAVSVSAGNLPVTGLFPFYAGLLTGTPTIHRPSSRGGGWIRELHASLSRIDPALARLAAVVETPSEDDGATEMLLRGVDEIRAQGDDDTLEHLRRLAPPDARFLPYRSRFSVAISGDPGCDELRGLVEDLFIWEQQGCLSPQVLFVPQAKAASLADHLLAAAEELATTWDRAPCNRHVGQRLWHQLTGEAEGDDVTFSSSPQMTLAVTNRVRPEWFGTPGFLQICPLERPEMAAELLGGLESRLSSVARSSDATVPTRLRPERIVRFGQLQSPELDWPQDGHDRFRPPR